MRSHTGRSLDRTRIAAADAASTAEDTAVTILASDLLANDTDPDGDTLTITSVQNATGGTAALDGNGDVVFTPTADFNGTATFDYTTTDGTDTATSTVTVNVSSVNDAPVTSADTASTLEDTTITLLAVAVINLLVVNLAYHRVGGLLV